jgi:hypothetical protein
LLVVAHPQRPVEFELQSLGDRLVALRPSEIMGEVERVETLRWVQGAPEEGEGLGSTTTSICGLRGVFATSEVRPRHPESMSPQDHLGYREGLPVLLSRAEAQQILCVSGKTLWRLVQSGKLPVVYIDRRPRFLPEDVWELVRSRRSRGGVAE